MARSPAVATAYIGFAQALAGCAGSLPFRLREQIALVVGEANACGYCVAAPTVLGRRAGLTEEEAKEARRASPHYGKEHAALVFARKVVRDRGGVTDDDVEQLRRAGYTDHQVGEIVANVALNIFTNYFKHVAGTELDFPTAPDLAAS
jgi:AhpD family alkylhydroperoxidase